MGHQVFPSKRRVEEVLLQEAGELRIHTQPKRYGVQPSPGSVVTAGGAAFLLLLFLERGRRLFNGKATRKNTRCFGCAFCFGMCGFVFPSLPDSSWTSYFGEDHGKWHKLIRTCFGHGSELRAHFQRLPTTASSHVQNSKCPKRSGWEPGAGLDRARFPLNHSAHTKESTRENRFMYPLVRGLDWWFGYRG